MVKSKSCRGCYKISTGLSNNFFEFFAFMVVSLGIYISHFHSFYSICMAHIISVYDACRLYEKKYRLFTFLVLSCRHRSLYQWSNNGEHKHNTCTTNVLCCLVCH